MNKDELIEALASKVGTSKKVATDFLSAMIDEVTKVLSKGGKVALPGFGAFSVGKRAARTGVNPRTGARLRIPAIKVPKFKAGKSLKDAVK